MRKENIEGLVDGLLRHILADTENRAILAADISDYYRRTYVDTNYLDGLRDELSTTTRSLDNLVKAIEQGLPFTDSVAVRLGENEERKKALAEAIEAEEARSRAAQDETSIGAFFERYSNADLDDGETRETLLDHFIDKICLYDDRLVVIGWYCDINHEMLDHDIEGLKEGEAAFEYVLNLSQGFECFAPDCTTITVASCESGRRFFFSAQYGDSNPSEIAYHRRSVAWALRCITSRALPPSASATLQLSTNVRRAMGERGHLQRRKYELR